MRKRGAELASLLVIYTVVIGMFSALT